MSLSRGPLIDFLADTIPKISIDLIKIIGEYYDVFTRLESFQSIPCVLVQVCTMCDSVDHMKVHFAGLSWKNSIVYNNPTASLANCCFCGNNRAVEIIHNIPDLNLLIRSQQPFEINPDGSLRMTCPTSVSYVGGICNNCLIRWDLSNNHILSTTRYNYIISSSIAQNRSLFFCPYWLAKATQWMYSFANKLIPHALLGAPSPFDEKGRLFIKECPPITTAQSELLSKFAKAHIYKLREDSPSCIKCHKDGARCGICHSTSELTSIIHGFPVCYRPLCWSLFSSHPHDKVPVTELCNCEFPPIKFITESE